MLTTMKRFLTAYFFCCFIFTTEATASPLTFGSKSSSIIVENGSILRVDPNQMWVEQGTIHRKELGSITGCPIRFNRGRFVSYNSQSDLTGVFNPDGGGIFEIGDNPDFANDADILVANPGGLPHPVLMKHGANFIRGQPLFFDANDITLQDAQTELAIAVQNTLNTNITLNGGYVFLQDDLKLGDNAIFNGDGQIIFNNRRLSLGGSTSTWTGNIIWNSALDIQLNSQTILQGTWGFYGDGQINGNSNVLDITGGGAIIVYPNSTLRLSGVNIKGLGSGGIYMGDGAQIRLSNTTIEMDGDYVIDSGGIYVDGDSTFITKDKLLTFSSSTDSHGSLTVDRVALTYDHQSYVDLFNIRPLRIQDPNHKYINIINSGAIRHFRQESISFLDYSADTVLQRYAIVTPQRPMKVFPEINQITMELNYSMTINGGTNFLGFTRSDEPIMFISDDVHALYENIIFRDFSPKHLSLGRGASLTFGNKTMVTLARNEVLDYPWVFQGNAMLRGSGQILELGPHGALVLQGENSSLLIDGVTLKNVSGNKIRCTQQSSTIIFKDVKWYQDADYTYSIGGIQLLGDLHLFGPYVFNYLSPQQFTIGNHAMLELLRFAVFHYEPSSGARDLLVMEDATASLRMEDATLEAPAPGMTIKGGWFILNNLNSINNPGGNDKTNGVIVGGSGDDYVFIQRPGEASIDVTDGFYDEVNVD